MHEVDEWLLALQRDEDPEPPSDELLADWMAYQSYNYTALSHKYEIGTLRRSMAYAARNRRFNVVEDIAQNYGLDTYKDGYRLLLAVEYRLAMLDDLENGGGW